MGARTIASRTGESLMMTHIGGLRFSFKRSLPLILQSEAAECGLACLAMVAAYHGYQANLLTLRQRFSPSLRGVNLKNLIDTAQAMQLATRAIRIELDALAHLTLPAILHWDMNHFVVLKEVKTKLDGTLRSIVIHDPANGRQLLSQTEISQRFH